MRIYEIWVIFGLQKHNLYTLQGTADSVIVLLFDFRTDLEYIKKRVLWNLVVNFLIFAYNILPNVLKFRRAKISFKNPQPAST